MSGIQYTESSEALFQRAKRHIPGGVNSPVRACLAVGCEPLFIARGSGGRIMDVDGNEYVDYVQSWGPLILGHAHPAVTKAVTLAAARGTSFGAPCEDEVLLAEELTSIMPGLEMVRMVNSGTEATMSALRLARAVTGKNALVKFEGCYHGHADPFLASAGSGVATLSLPGTPGVPEAVVGDTLLAPYNDLGAVEELFATKGKNIGAVIVEPAAGNMGLIPPRSGFLEGLRSLCDTYGALLIFDEVITGFRAGLGGAQARFRVKPDLTTLGKIIGGGLPVGAYGGSRRYMERVAPEGDVYQAGTLSGNPLAMAAGLAALRVLKTSHYQNLELQTEEMCQGMEERFTSRGIPVCVHRLASMFTIFFTGQPVIDFTSAKKADSGRYARFYRAMRERGVLFAPSAFETAMVSFAHTPEDFKTTLDALEASLSAIV